MGFVRASQPRFRRVDGPPARMKLTEDDVALIRAVHRYRFVRAVDLFRLVPERTPDRLSRRLTLLFRAGYLGRPLSQIDRFKQGGGSQSLVYGLDRAGARFLKERFGTSIGETNWKARHRTYTRENLDHTLTIASFMIDLEIECREAGVSFIPFEEILSKAPEKTRQASMPGRWSVSVTHRGCRADTMICPDAIFGLRLVRTDAATLTSYFFLEIDRGTMTIVPTRHIRETDAFLHRATMLRKLMTYAESWRLGLHRERFAVHSARVLTISNGAARAKSVRELMRGLVCGEGDLPSGLFVFGTADQGVNALVDAAGNQAVVLSSLPQYQ